MTVPDSPAYPEQNAEYVLPEGMTADKLREVAAWLDAYDEMAASYYEIIVHAGLSKSLDNQLVMARIASQGREVQNELRQWAARIDCSRAPSESDIS